MNYTIRLGEPEIAGKWKNLMLDIAAGEIGKEDRQLLDKWSRAMEYLGENPFHPSLRTHEISDLTEKFGRKVLQSYLENRTKHRPPYRMFWVYGPDEKEITIVGLTKHPDKRKEYKKIVLSGFPESTQEEGGDNTPEADEK